MVFDPQPWRADTTAACAGRIHLNNAGAALMPRPVFAAMTEHFQHENELGGYEAADAAAPLIGEAYQSVARLIGAAPRNIAVVENATVAMSSALSSFDFQRGDVLLTTRNDYISNQLMYLSLVARLGVDVVRAEDAPEGGVDPQSVRELVRSRRPKLVCLTYVPTNSGLVQPAEEVGHICEEEGVPYVLDACQAVGQLPVDVSRLRCTFLAATARKFLRGPRGVGFLYVSDTALAEGRHPLYVDMRGARWTDDDAYRLVEDARRFENWEFAYGLMLGMGAAAKYALKVSIDQACGYVRELASHLRARLGEMPGVRVLDRGPSLCAIVTAAFEGHAADEIVARLREQAINTSATVREWAVIDMKEKNATSAVRISPHYYNTRREIDIALFALEEFATE
jgi:selenocysteine lyase/cysteine desulfurase